MLKKFPRQYGQLLVLSISMFLAGCATTTPVKHLSSDVCLVMPESTTKIEVLSFLGEPDEKFTTPEHDETWVYLKKNENIARKLPIIGEKYGLKDYETVTITFTGDKVKTCIYRQLTPAEFADFNKNQQIEIPK